MSNDMISRKKKKVSSKTKQKHVVAVGVFDILHEGHVHYLSFAKKQGDVLTVIVARDANVMRAKGYAPIMNERQRRNMVQSLRAVDHAVVGSRKDKLGMIVSLNPSIVVVGYDHPTSASDLEKALAERGVDAHVLRAPAFKKKVFKSSLIKKKIVQSFQNTST